MNEMEYEKLLEEHGIKPTANRILVVKTLALRYSLSHWQSWSAES